MKPPKEVWVCHAGEPVCMLAFFSKQSAKRFGGRYASRYILAPKRKPKKRAKK